MADETPAVLVLALARGFGGVNMRVIQTAQGLRDRGWRYRVMALEGSPLHEALRREGLECVAVDLGRGDPRILLRLRATVRAMKAEVLDAHNFQSQVWAMLYGVIFGSVARVASVHTIYRLANESRLKGRVHEMALRACRMAGFRFMAVSQSICAYLRSLGVSEPRITLSRNGVRPSEIDPPQEDLRTELGWPPSAFVICFVGRLEYQKNLGLLLEAFAKVKEQGDIRACLLLVGEGSKRHELEVSVAHHGLSDVVAFTGYRTDAAGLLRQADLLCLTSHTEGLPYVLLEASQRAIPVVSAETDGASELFVHDRDILFFPPGDVPRLAELLLWAIREPVRLRRIGQAMQQRVMEELSVDRMTDQTLELYRTAASHRTGPHL